jgi:hypothetical protein
MYLRIGVFFVLSYFLLVLLAVTQQATGILPPDAGLPQWGPGLAALLMLVIFRKDKFKITLFSKETPGIGITSVLSGGCRCAGVSHRLMGWEQPDPQNMAPCYVVVDAIRSDRRNSDEAVICTRNWTRVFVDFFPRSWLLWFPSRKLLRTTVRILLALDYFLFDRDYALVQESGFSVLL